MSKLLQNAPLKALCNTFDLYLATIGLENQFLVFFRVAIFQRFYLLCLFSDLTFKAPPVICSRRQLKFLLLFQK